MVLAAQNLSVAQTNLAVIVIAATNVLAPTANAVVNAANNSNKRGSFLLPLLNFNIVFNNF